MGPDPRTEIIAWIREHASVIDTVDPAAPVHDLGQVRDWMVEASVVGLGASIRGVRSGHELYRLKHRLTRLAVESLGVRTIALEDSPEVGRLLDDYVLSGSGEPEDALQTAWGPWRTEEFAHFIRWLQA